MPMIRPAYPTIALALAAAICAAGGIAQATPAAVKAPFQVAQMGATPMAPPSMMPMTPPPAMSPMPSPTGTGM
jgi:hypothetical protein